MKTNMDFRLNKAHIKAFVELLLNLASENATDSTGETVDFVIKPGSKFNFKYGHHMNAQEVNNFTKYDKSTVEICTYKNGNLAGSFWIVLKLEKFNAKILNYCPIQEYVDETELSNFYNEFLYLIFGENYKEKLLSFYEQNKSDKLKSMNAKYKSLMQQASKENPRKKATFRTKYNKNRDYFAHLYDEQINFAKNLNTNFFDE